MKTESTSRCAFVCEQTRGSLAVYGDVRVEQALLPSDTEFSRMTSHKYVQRIDCPHFK
jgi:hypothetical protein